jgi:aminoglycoside N3'-acetyltransferase
LTSRTILVEQLRALGVEPGDVLLVHSSFRAVRPVEDGPAGLIAALQEAVGESGTIVMPAWTEDDDSPFDPASTPVSTSLGVVPATKWTDACCCSASVTIPTRRSISPSRSRGFRTAYQSIARS